MSPPWPRCCERKFVPATTSAAILVSESCTRRDTRGAHADLTCGEGGGGLSEGTSPPEEVGLMLPVRRRGHYPVLTNPPRWWRWDHLAARAPLGGHGRGSRESLPANRSDVGLDLA